MGIKALVIGERTLPLLSKTPYLLEGLAPVRRTIRTLSDAGVEEALLLLRNPSEVGVVRGDLGGSGHMKVEATQDRARACEVVSRWLQAGDRVLLASHDLILDPRLVAFLASRVQGSGVLVASNAGREEREGSALGPLLAIVAPNHRDWLVGEISAGSLEWDTMVDRLERRPGVQRLDVDEMPRYDPAMRREVTPYHIWLRAGRCVRQARHLLVESAGKGASDALAYYVHRPIEDAIVERLVPTKITPNMLTILTNILAWTVTGLYLLGWIAPGLVLAFVVGVVDGLDGKLARAKALTSKTGKLEHSLDMLYEYSWIVALAINFSSGLEHAVPLLLAAGIVLNVSFYRSCYDQFRGAMGRSLDDFGRFERVFRRVAGRRNLYNLHILFWLVVGQVQICLFTILVHSILTSIVYFWRAFKHLRSADLAGLGRASGTASGI